MPRVITTEAIKYLKERGMQVPCKLREVLWRGPGVDGITFSLLSRFLVDRERFRVLVVEGLKPISGFNQRIDYGTMWHACEEQYANYIANDPKWVPKVSWQQALDSCTRGFTQRYPADIKQIVHWHTICKLQFPIYVDYWAKHSDVTNRTPILAEVPFKVPYKLPSGRTVLLRGKWDSVDKVEDSEGSGWWLQENKTKGDINEAIIARQLGFDLQTMMYLVALHECDWTQLLDVLSNPQINVFQGRPRIEGVRYNVVRRPLSGGRGTIRQKKGQTEVQFYHELRSIIQGEPEYYFMRYKVRVTLTEVARFQRECLNPILESLCDWWEWISASPHNPFTLRGNRIHWRHPFGVYNILNEGGSTELDGYLTDGSEVGLKRVETLFPELEGV